MASRQANRSGKDAMLRTRLVAQTTNGEKLERKEDGQKAPTVKASSKATAGVWDGWQYFFEKLEGTQ